MMCDRCRQPMTAEESEPYEIPGATGPGITLHLHKGSSQDEPKRGSETILKA